MVKPKEIAIKLHEQIHLRPCKDKLTTLILPKLEKAATKIANKIKQWKANNKRHHIANLNPEAFKCGHD